MKKTSLHVVRNEVDKSASITLYGIIGDSWFSDDPITAKRFQQKLSALESQFDVINIHINSPGGDVWEGLAICNAIKASKKEIHTWNDGLCASMAATILVSAADNQRHAAKGSITMIHNASSICWGNSEDMRDTAEFLDKHDDVLAGFFADASKQTVEQIKAKYFDYKDHYLTAEEAAEIGFVKIETYEADDVPENITNMPFNRVAAYYNKNISITQNQNSNMFGHKFPKMAALAKVAAAAVTQAQVDAANTEIAEAEIEGVTLVLDTELATANSALENQPVLEKKIQDLEAKVLTIADLEKQIADQKKKLDAAAEAADAPGAVNHDSTSAPKNEEETYETTVDAEAKRLWG